MAKEEARRRRGGARPDPEPEPEPEEEEEEEEQVDGEDDERRQANRLKRRAAPWRGARPPQLGDQGRLRPVPAEL